jgi:hypothetical protein
MNLKRTLSALVNAVAEEADKNDAFRRNVEHALGINVPGRVAEAPTSSGQAAGKSKRRGRRNLAVLDPVQIARQGERALRSEIDQLTLEQLRDVVAQYGMDPGKLVMKWKDRNRVIDRIIELSLARATKGDAFRAD